jgi:threonine-phosphate decarboxylase
MQQHGEVLAFTEETRKFIKKERNLLIDKLKSVQGITIFPSTTSFFLVGLPEHMTSDSVCSSLAEKKILIRNCSNFNGLSNRYVRISLKTRKTNLMLAEKLSSLCSPEEQGKYKTVNSDM